jgi:hypothetical protein
MSIFEEYDKTINNNTFWWDLSATALIDIKEHFLYSSTAKIASKRQGFKTRRFILTTSSLYYCKTDSNTPKKQTIVNWKQTEAFIEESSSDSRYVLKLGHSTLSQELFFPTSSSLDAWLSPLSKTTILTDFDDDFVTIKDLGQGSYAKVFLVKSLSSGKFYAAKCVSKKKLLASSRGPWSVVSEISTMRRLSHPQIVRLHWVYEDDQSVFLVLDLLEGGDLHRRLAQKGKFTEASARTVAFSLLQGVAYIHAQELIHRDLKLHNVFLVSTTGDDVRIGDFGLVCSANEPQLRKCGSAGFIAPEILTLQPYSAKVDMFSIGVILYTLICGRSPFYGNSSREVLMNNQSAKVYFVSDEWEEISRDCIDFILQLVEAEPESRMSAEQALAHNWMKGSRNCEKKGQKMVAPMIRCGIQGKELRCSNILMMRMNQKRDCEELGMNDFTDLGNGGVRKKEAGKVNSILKKLREDDFLE